MSDHISVSMDPIESITQLLKRMVANAIDKANKIQPEMNINLVCSIDPKKIYSFVLVEHESRRYVIIEIGEDLVLVNNDYEAKSWCSTDEMQSVDWSDPNIIEILESVIQNHMGLQCSLLDSDR